MVNIEQELLKKDRLGGINLGFANIVTENINLS